ncbi:hypothetical protein RclHR1_01020008 [Rhizophagus clarus]|uniref:Ion transport domain-containing protein n=1 Tax=Rhizophagus clarus TaxID=94130 RepID=A0A2Z6Q151_9GLOM|nr:hypothetical protein RclHR1_01020008 [Rhizophagus clarus]GES95311.1 hypothetical protein GLOIN_2v1875127 [Rhizophagus clarus]
MNNDIVIQVSTSESGIKESSEPLSSSHSEQLICSSSLKYVATWNEKDKVINIWRKPSSVNVVVSLDKLTNITLNELIDSLSHIKIDFHKLIELVDIYGETLMILELETNESDPHRVVYDLKNKRSLMCKYARCEFIKWKFLENGNLVTMHKQSDESCLKIELYIIKNGLYKPERSYYILTNSCENSYLFSQGQLMHGSKFLRQWNVINGDKDFEHQYYLGCSKSVQVCFNERLLAVRKSDNSLIIYSKKTGMAFFQHHQVKIRDISFCKESDLLIIQEDNDDGFNYHFVDPYFGNILYTKLLNNKHRQLIVHENVISIVNNSVQIENIFKGAEEQPYRKMSTHFLLSMTNNASIIGEYKSELKEFDKCDEYIEVSVTWKIYKSKRKLSANKNSQEVDYIILDKKAFNIFYLYILPNDDLVIHTSSDYGIIFTLNNQNKIELVFYSQLSADNKCLYNYENDSFERIFNEFMDQPIIIEMIINYLDNISTFTLYASHILRAAIKTHKGDIIDLIIEKCIDHYNKNPENIYIFKIITKSISEIQEYNHYYVKKFLNYTSLIKAPQKNKYEQVLKQKDLFIPIFILFQYHHLYGFTHNTDDDSYLLKSNTFLNFFRSLGDISYSSYSYLKSNLLSKKRSAIKLYIPLPQFVSYPTNYNFFKEFLLGPEPNEFLKLKDTDLYSDWNGEALLNFKWRKFGRFWYCINWLLYTIFLISFALATHGKFQRTTYYFSAALGFFQLLFFELRQFLWKIKKYVGSIWNLFDLIAYILPIIISIKWLKNQPLPPWVSSISIFFLELKFVFFLRVFEQFCIYFAIIIGVAKNTISFFVILAFIILVYSHAYIVLNDQTNMNFIDSFLAMYKLMTGDTSNLEFQKNPEIIVIWITFSVFTVIYLLNLFIGLLNEEIQKIDKKALFLHQRAEILAEIELFNLFPCQRRWKSWFPDHIFYYVDVDKLQKKLNEINNNDMYKDSSYKPIIHPDLLDLITSKVTNSIDLIENRTQDKILEIINPNLLKNKDQVSIILKFNGKKLVNCENNINTNDNEENNEDKVFKSMNIEENNIQDYLKSILNIIKSNVSKNKNNLTITLEFKDTKLVKYESQVD